MINQTVVHKKLCTSYLYHIIYQFMPNKKVQKVQNQHRLYNSQNSSLNAAKPLLITQGVFFNFYPLDLDTGMFPFFVCDIKATYFQCFLKSTSIDSL